MLHATSDDGEPQNSLIVNSRLTRSTAQASVLPAMIEDDAKLGSAVGGERNYDAAWLRRRLSGPRLYAACLAAVSDPKIQTHA